MGYTRRGLLPVSGKLSGAFTVAAHWGVEGALEYYCLAGEDIGGQRMLALDRRSCERLNATRPLRVY